MAEQTIEKLEEQLEKLNKFSKSLEYLGTVEAQFRLSSDEVVEFDFDDDVFSATLTFIDKQRERVELRISRQREKKRPRKIEVFLG